MQGFFITASKHKCSDCNRTIPKGSRVYLPRDDITDDVILCMICVNFYGIEH